MDFPDADLTDARRDRSDSTISKMVGVGEFTETGEVRLKRQILFGRDDLPCLDIDTELLDRRIRNGLVTQ